MKKAPCIFLFLSSLLWSEWVSSYAPKVIPTIWTDNKIRFIWFSDNHNSEDYVDNLHLSMRKLIDTCRNYLPTALISTGDLTTRGPHGIAASLLDVHDCLRPFVFCVGNHDENVDTASTDPYYPDSDHSKYIPFYGFDAPYYKAYNLYSGDSTFKLLVLALDINYYDTSLLKLPNKEQWSRIGIFADGGFNRGFPPFQIAWVDSALKRDTVSNGVLVLTHCCAFGFGSIANRLVEETRPVIVFRGHNHAPQPVEYVDDIPIYKVPAFMGDGTVYGGFCKWVMHLENDTILVDSAIMLNYTKPEVWDTLYEPFTMPGGGHQ
jgi:predicted MPP superfamily phosphohydrolase